jgi:hypothetical protein
MALINSRFDVLLSHMLITGLTRGIGLKDENFRPVAILKPGVLSPELFRLISF